MLALSVGEVRAEPDDSWAVPVWGEELSMVVRLASHPRGPHPVRVDPPETVAALSVSPDDCAELGGDSVPVRHTSGVTVTYEVTAEGQSETVTVVPYS